MSKLKRLQVFRKPQKFVSFKGTDLDINENVLSELRGLSHHLVVVTIIGSYRTGKSWILNQLAECSVKDGFGVADGQSPVTSGIWILCREHPEKKNCVIVFLDTEGLHDPFKGDAANDDNRLFVLSFLLSDTFIYNVMHKLSDHDLEKIGFITKICKNLLESEAKKTFPEFLLLLRDVAKLKLDKRPVESVEYFENILASGDQGNADLSPKRCIKQLCLKRTCFTLTQPTDFEDLEELGETEQPELKPKFLEEFGKFKGHIIKFADIKRIMSGSPYTISAFCEFILEIVDVVSSNKIPRIESLQQRVANKENKRLWEQITDEFKRHLRDRTKIDLYGSFKEMYSILKRNGLEQLQMQLVPLSEDYLHETVEKFKSFAEEEFHSLSRELCLDILDGYLQPLFDKVKDKSYTSPGAKERFQADLKRVQDLYEKKENLGPEKANVWKEKEREMNRKIKEVELQDLQNELLAISAENKQERERIDQRVNEVKQELEEEKRKIEKRERELEQKRLNDAMELEQKRQRDEDKLKMLNLENKQTLEQMKELQQTIEIGRNDLAKKHETIVEGLKEMKRIEAAEIKHTNDANVTAAAIDGIAGMTIAFINAFSNK